ncbi:MAG: L,D-transpeptidase, partial [Pseudolabrys sp.]|nr:L,D-transpeptidase [Pseudolabrys sp.]
MKVLCVRRAVGLVLALGGASAQAQQMMVMTPTYGAPQPRMVIVQPSHQQDRVDLGGGFVEFLFGGGNHGPQVAPPPPPPDARPLYANIAPTLDPQEYDGNSIDPVFLKQEVAYRSEEAPGTVVIDTPNKFLYLVEGGGRAVRYGIGVGRPGFTWAGTHAVSAKREWPDWHPPDEMLKRQPWLP